MSTSSKLAPALGAPLAGASTTPRTSTTPAASPSWRPCAARPGRDIVDAGLTALLNLDHRGAVGAEADSGDGAGILTQIPDAFLRDVVDAELPPAGQYAIGMAFLPRDAAEPGRRRARASRRSPPRRSSTSSPGATSR